MNATQRKILSLHLAVMLGSDHLVTYRDRTGRVSIRTVRVYAVERCQNGATVARVVDMHENGGPRCFHVRRIIDITPGSNVVLPSR